MWKSYFNKWFFSLNPHRCLIFSTTLDICSASPYCPSSGGPSVKGENMSRQCWINTEANILEQNTMRHTTQCSLWKLCSSGQLCSTPWNANLVDLETSFWVTKDQSYDDHMVFSCGLYWSKSIHDVGYLCASFFFSMNWRGQDKPVNATDANSFSIHI